MELLISEHNASQDTGLCPETGRLASSLIVKQLPVLLSAFRTLRVISERCCYFIDRIHPCNLHLTIFTAFPADSCSAEFNCSISASSWLEKGWKVSLIDNSNSLLLQAGTPCHIPHKLSELQHQKAFKVTLVTTCFSTRLFLTSTLPKVFWLFVHFLLCTVLFSQRQKQWLFRTPFISLTCS